MRRGQIRRQQGIRMFDIFPKTPKTIRARIQSYERKLKQELETGYGGDGYGKRYLPGPLYMLPGATWMEL